MTNSIFEYTPEKISASGRKKLVIPRTIRLESSTQCQLHCPTCPTGSGETIKFLGSGYLSFEDFKNTIDRNPWIISVELSNWGEMFLNRDLIHIMRYANKNQIALSASNGVNLNLADKNILEALVKFRFRKISCSIDGASQLTYSMYRRGGGFDQVISNINTINYFKTRYKSLFPQLYWKFVVFGHNEHEIAKARQMASDLNMAFYVKLSWEDLYSPVAFSPVKNREKVRMETGLGAADRKEFREKYGYDYILRDCCIELWRRPQINYDGRVLGCSVNYWNDYGNAFQSGLFEALNNEKINYARAMVMGLKESRADIPCAFCKYYARMKEEQNWIKEKDVLNFYIKDTPYVEFIHKLFRNKVTNKLYRALRSVKRKLKPANSAVKSLLFNSTHQKFLNKGRIKSKVFQLELPLAPDLKNGWRPCSIFKGSTRIIEKLTCHASVLVSKHCPHAPHAHDDEELLVVLFGEVDILLPAMPDDKNTIRLKRGDFVYYPAGFPHTIKTASVMPSNYLMLKWRNTVTRINPELSFVKYDIFSGENIESEGFKAQEIFRGTTSYLDNLRCHVSTLTPGAGYDAHQDPYDVAIIVFDGEVETLGKKVSPNGVIFYAAGQLHSMYNPGEVAARYLVFEFHAATARLRRAHSSMLIAKTT